MFTDLINASMAENIIFKMWVNKVSVVDIFRIVTEHYSHLCSLTYTSSGLVQRPREQHSSQ